MFTVFWHLIRLKRERSYKYANSTRCIWIYKPSLKWYAAGARNFIVRLDLRSKCRVSDSRMTNQLRWSREIAAMLEITCRDFLFEWLLASRETVRHTVFLSFVAERAKRFSTISSYRMRRATRLKIVNGSHWSTLPKLGGQSRAYNKLNE